MLAVVDILKQQIKDESFDVVSTVEGVDLLLAVIDDTLSVEDIQADSFSLFNDNLPKFDLIRFSSSKRSRRKWQLRFRLFFREERVAKRLPKLCLQSLPLKRNSARLLSSSSLTSGGHCDRRAYRTEIALKTIKVVFALFL